MKTVNIFLFFLLLANCYSQEAETIIDSDFAIRDFIVQEDSIIFLKKRDIHLNNNKIKSNENYFVGGYGLKFFTKNNSNTIISASNELVRNVSSIRFYNKKNKKVEEVFYNKETKILDFLVVPESNFFILSLINKKIIFVDYSKKPEFTKIIEIKLNALSRKLIYKNKNLFYVTDSGEVYQYDMLTNSEHLLYKGNALITDFLIDNNILFYSTIDGKIVKYNIFANKKEVINLGNDFITYSLSYKNNKLVCGSWKGNVYLIDLKRFEIVKKEAHHKETIFKIINIEDNIFYSSSLDTTIKKWILKKNN